MTQISRFDNATAVYNQYAATAAETKTQTKSTTTTTSTIQTVTPPDTRTWWQYLAPEAFGGKPAPVPVPIKPEEKKVDAPWYMVPVNALCNLGSLIFNAVKSLFHLITFGVFQEQAKVETNTGKVKTQ